MIFTMLSAGAQDLEGPCQDWPFENIEEAEHAIRDATARWWELHGDGSRFAGADIHSFPSAQSDGTSWVRVYLQIEGISDQPTPIGSVRVYPSCRVEPDKLATAERRPSPAPIPHDVGPCQHWPELSAKEALARAAARWWEEQEVRAGAVGYHVTLPQDGGAWAEVDVVDSEHRAIAWLRVDRSCRVEARPRTCIHCRVSSGWITIPHVRP